MTLVQIMIFILGSSGIWLVGRKESWRRWGFILGLAGQPFWFYMAYTTKQWGVLAMCCVYTYTWGAGMYNNWIKNPTKDLFEAARKQDEGWGPPKHPIVSYERIFSIGKLQLNRRQEYRFIIERNVQPRDYKKQIFKTRYYVRWGTVMP